MRPVLKGANPIDENGNVIIFTRYARSRRYLIDRIGEYCSYCERKIEANLAVEHVQPKDTNPNLSLEWSNFLLGCTNCNSTKGNKQVTLDDFVWPDIDNTFNYFEYNETGIVNIPFSIVDPNLRAKIQKMLDLVGLQKHPPRLGTADWKEASDRRFEHRIQAWLDANHYMELYNSSTNEIREIMIPLIITIVLNQGFWSLWMNVFSEFTEVQIELLNKFVGTNIGLFPHLIPLP